MPASKMKANIAKVLKEEGFIKSFKIIAKDNKLTLRVALKEGALVGIDRVSKPGLRIYKGYNEMPELFLVLVFQLYQPLKVLFLQEKQSMQNLVEKSFVTFGRSLRCHV
jgi:hypothetical protein